MTVTYQIMLLTDFVPAKVRARYTGGLVLYVVIGGIVIDLLFLIVPLVKKGFRHLKKLKKKIMHAIAKRRHRIAHPPARLVRPNPDELPSTCVVGYVINNTQPKVNKDLSRKPIVEEIKSELTLSEASEVY